MGSIYFWLTMPNDLLWGMIEVWQKTFSMHLSNMSWTLATCEFLWPQSHFWGISKVFLGTTDLNAAPCTCPCALRICNVAGLQTFSFFKNCTFLFMYHIFIWKQCHLWTLLIFWNTKTLTACNFAAPWGKWTSSTFLETSNLIEFGARWSWGWQDF